MQVQWTQSVSLVKQGLQKDVQMLRNASSQAEVSCARTTVVNTRQKLCLHQPHCKSRAGKGITSIRAGKGITAYELSCWYSYTNLQLHQQQCIHALLSPTQIG